MVNTCPGKDELVSTNTFLKCFFKIIECVWKQVKKVKGKINIWTTLPVSKEKIQVHLARLTLLLLLRKDTCQCLDPCSDLKTSTLCFCIILEPF